MTEPRNETANADAAQDAALAQYKRSLAFHEELLLHAHYPPEITGLGVLIFRLKRAISGEMEPFVPQENP